MSGWPFKCPSCGSDLRTEPASGVYGRCGWQILYCSGCSKYYAYVSHVGKYVQLSWSSYVWNWRELDEALSKLGCVDIPEVKVEDARLYEGTLLKWMRK